MLELIPEIVRLKELIVKFDEGKPGLQTNFYRLRRKHAIDAKMDADISKEIDVVEFG
jgi:hypothetical protein